MEKIPEADLGNINGHQLFKDVEKLRKDYGISVFGAVNVIHAFNHDMTKVVTFMEKNKDKFVVKLNN